MIDEIGFTCRNCGRGLSASKDAAGRIAECPECGEPLVIPDFQADDDEPDEASDADVPVRPCLSAAPTFVSSIPAAFSYPFRGNGKGVLLGGMVFFLCIHILRIVPLVGVIVGLMGTGYLCAFAMHIVRSSAGGEDDPPDWPECTNWEEDLLAPVLQLVGAAAVSFLPLAIYVFSGAGRGDWHTDAIAWTLLTVGCLYLPMALLTVSLFGTFRVLNPVTALAAISRVPGDYGIATALLALAVVVSSAASAAAAAVPFAGAIVKTFSGLYFIMVEMRLIGVLYHTNRERLNWFGERS